MKTDLLLYVSSHHTLATQSLQAGAYTRLAKETKSNKMDPGYRYGRDQDHEHSDPGDYCDYLFIHASPLRESGSEQTASRRQVG